MTTARAFQMFTTVWGDWHLEMLEKIMLPTLLAANNVPAAAAKFSLKYSIFTRVADQRRIEEMPVLQALSRIIPVEVVASRQEDEISIYDHMPWWVELIDRGRRNNSYVMAMHPDVAWSNGAISLIVDALARGKKGVILPSLRAVSETGVPELRSGIETADQPIALTPHELLKIGMHNMHPVSMAELSGISPSTPGPERIWAVPGEGFINRIFVRQLIMLDPVRCKINERIFAVDLDGLDDVEFVSNSDDFAMLDLTPLAKDLGILALDSPADVGNPAKWSVGQLWDSPVNDTIAKQNIYYRVGDSTPAKWAAAEAAADKEFGLVMNYRRWLTIRRTVREAGCTEFADLLGCAILIADLPATFPLNGNEIVFAPTDDAFKSSAEGSTKLLAQGSEAALGAFVQRHVSPRQTKEAGYTIEVITGCR
jgi:hypothetical protein